MPLSRLNNGNRIVHETQRGGMPRSVTVGVNSALMAGMREAFHEIGAFSQQLSQALDARLIPTAERKAANMQLAEEAQQAIVRGWHSRLPAKSPAYRRGPNPRYDRLSGLLGPTLASPDMLRATTASTVSFLNVALLNRETRHWYRVNYGALGPNVSPQRAQAHPVNIDGHTVFTLEDEAPPAPQSWLPRAFISYGREYFQPTRGPADVAGGGSRAALFTELGFESLARNIDPVYDNMFRRFCESAVNRQKLEVRDIHVPVDLRGGPRPTIHG